MAPIVAESINFEKGVDKLLIISTAVASLSLAIFVLICSCCGQKTLKNDDDKKPKLNSQDSNSAVAGQFAQEQMATAEMPKSTEAANPSEKAKSVFILPKKEAIASSAKVVPKKQSKSVQQVKKLSIPAAPAGQKSQIQSLLDVHRSGSGSVPALNQMSVVQSGSQFPQVPSKTNEPEYPEQDAVEFENPAYHTIGPDFDDPFKGFSLPKKDAPFVVAKLVEPPTSPKRDERKQRKHSPSEGTTDKSSSTPTTTPTSSTPTQATTTPKTGYSASVRTERTMKTKK